MGLRDRRRGATGHCAVYRALGLSTSGHREETDNHVSVPYGRGIRVEKSVTVNATPEQLYAFWRNFENLPRFMDHLEMVHVIDAKRPHWRTKGPAGTTAGYDRVKQAMRVMDRAHVLRQM